MTAIVLTVAGIAIMTVSFFALAWWVLWYFTRDTGTHAAPRRQRGDWDEPENPGDWLPAPEWLPPVAHEEEWRAAIAEQQADLGAWHDLLQERQAELDERQAALAEVPSGVIVADVYHPSPAPPGDYSWREPFIWWESDTNVGGMLAITAGGK